MQQSYSSDKAGFTLIEMSIVLVIIGLVVGGVLVGQQLIQSAAANAQISQINKYNSAVNLFDTKYNYLPGDMTASVASNYGFTARGGQRGRGDGNGMIEGYDYVNNTVYDWAANGETLFFWEDLSQAGLIDGTFTTATDANANCSTPSACSAYMPQAKIGNNSYVYVYSGYASTCCAANYTTGMTPNLFGISSMTAMWSGAITYLPGITVIQAYNIDKKIDDGSPVTGTVLAQCAYCPNGTYPGGAVNAIGWAANAAAGSSTTCFDTSSGTAAYSLTQNGGSGLNCALSFQFQDK